MYGSSLSKVWQQRTFHISFIWKHPWQKVVRLAAFRQSKIMPVFPKYLKTVELNKINLEFVIKTFFLCELFSNSVN